MTKKEKREYEYSNRIKKGSEPKYFPRKVDVISVEDVPRKMGRYRWRDLIEQVYELPKGRGLKLGAQSERFESVRRVSAISHSARLLGMPVCCRIRVIVNSGYHVFVFKKTDLTLLRAGKETR